MIAEFLHHTAALYLDAAPWLLLGLLAAGLIQAWVPQSALNRWLGGSGFGPVLRAALIGAPLPLCSCGVVPAALSLRRAGASRGATVSFLVATPETGVDSVAVTWALMGPFMAVVRPLAAIGSALAAGMAAALAPAQEKSKTVFPLVVASCGGGSCGCGSAPPAPQGPTALRGLRYAVTDLVDDIAPWMAGGLLLAGAMLTLVPPAALAEWGQGPLAMLVMLVIGVPMYICATASTPLAAALLVAGVSPGAVLVFLLAGPATNAGTLGLLRKELGGRVVLAYLAGISVAALGFGLATDALIAGLAIDIPAQVAEAGELVPFPLALASGVLLLILALRPLAQRLLRRAVW